MLDKLFRFLWASPFDGHYEELVEVEGKGSDSGWHLWQRIVRRIGWGVRQIS